MSQPESGARTPDVPLATLIAGAVERRGATSLHFHTQHGAETCTTTELRHDHAALGLSAMQRHFSSAGVAKQMTPQRLFIVAELPRAPSGKVRKGDLRKQVLTLC
jgi:non-ribosomal peptide synthetase component E (peptide arylation enzyme)